MEPVIEEPGDHFNNRLLRHSSSSLPDGTTWEEADGTGWYTGLYRNNGKENGNCYMLIGSIFVGIPTVRTMAYWGLHRGPLIQGNYNIWGHMGVEIIQGPIWPAQVAHERMPVHTLSTRF